MTLQPHTFGSEIQNEIPNDLVSDFTAERLRRRVILLVDDEPFVREATCSILECAGFEVLPSENAQEATKIYAAFRRHIDLLMTDMILPGRTGEQLAHDLQECSPELPVLITSGYFNPEYETETPEAHTYFLSKPYSRRTLIEKIDQILGMPQQRSATQQAG